MFEVEKHMHKPFFEREPVPHMPCGPHPHEKPRYTMTEEVEHTARLMRETIERLLRFEERVKTEIADLSRNLTADNVIFKNSMCESWNTFLMEVKNEINIFEGNIEADLKLFKADIESNYANMSEDVNGKISDLESRYEQAMTELKASVQEQYNSFVESVNSRLDANNEATSQAFADFQRQLTTQLNTFEQTMNANYATFTESIGNSMHEFRTHWEQIITERFAAQDGKLSDAEMYMKTNLEANIATLIGDMHANGELADIIEGEVFNDLSTTVKSFDAMSVKYFGAKGDGVTDDTAAFALAFSLMGSRFNTLTIPFGVYCVNHVEFPENSVIYAVNATLKRNAHDGNEFVTFGPGCTIYGDMEFDGDKAKATAETESGVVFMPGCTSYGTMISYNHSKHGFVVDSGNRHEHLIAYENGKTGTASGNGKADGVYIVNAFNVLIKRIVTCTNKRMGLTVTTFNEATNAPDCDLTGNVWIENMNAYDNVYKDVDIEYARDVVLKNVECASSLAASHSEDCVFDHCRTGGYYSNGGMNNIVNDFVVRPSGTCNDVVYVDGDNNKITNVHVVDSADSYTGNTVVIKGANIVDNVHIENGNNAFVCEGANTCSNIVVDKGNNRLRTVDGVTIPSNKFKVDCGKIIAYGTAPLSGGTPGDVVYNTGTAIMGESGNRYVIDKWICCAINVWATCTTPVSG